MISNGVTRVKLPYTRENKVAALDDMWVFADLIRFSFMKPFGEVHQDLAKFVIAPQVHSDAYVDAYKNKVFEGELSDEVIRLLKMRHRLILMPRGHLKSTIGSVLYVLWRIYRNPNIRILVACNKKMLAKKFIRLVRLYLEDEDLGDNLWNARPHISGQLIPIMERGFKKRRDNDETEAKDKKVLWSADAIQVVRPMKSSDPTLQAVSAGTVATGAHVDLIIQDDVVDDTNSNTEEKIESLHDWCADLEFILDPMSISVCGTGKYGFTEVIGDEVIRIGTRYAKGDIYEWTEAEQDDLLFSTFIRNIYNNGKDTSDGYLWPGRFNDHEVRKRRKGMSARVFASQYLNQIVASEDKAFKKEDIQYYPKARVQKMDAGGFYKFLNEGEEGKAIGQGVPFVPVIAIDPAMGLSTGDDTALAVGGKIHTGELIVLDEVVGKLGPSDTIKALFGLLDKWGCKIVHVETVGVGAGLIENIKKECKRVGRPTPRLIEFKSQVKKEERITNYLQPLTENHELWLTHKLSTCEPLNTFWDFFPATGVHDDAGDVLAILAQVTRPYNGGGQVKTHRTQLSRTPYRVNKRYGGIR